MDWAPASAIRSLFDTGHGASDLLIPRWLFLRVLGLIYFFCVFLSCFSDPWAHWPRRNSATRLVEFYLSEWDEATK
jgi:hypothetical protein